MAPKLDRIPSEPDPIRAELYNVADLKVQGVPVAELEPRSYSWSVPFHLDQGNEGACVAHDVVHEALARPKPVTFDRRLLPEWAERARRVQAFPEVTNRLVAQAFAFDGYDWCRRNDEWFGENYSGTSQAAGGRMAVAAGFWREYRWADTVRDFLTGVSRHGPGCLAIDWHTGMMRPDSDGFIHPTGTVEGGHSILMPIVALRKFKYPAVGLWQSWGDMPIWWMWVGELEEVVASNGEMQLPTARVL